MTADYDADRRVAPSHLRAIGQRDRRPGSRGSSGWHSSCTGPAVSTSGPRSQGEYRDRPLEGAVSPPLPRPEPEFHERCAMAGDHPALLRTARAGDRPAGRRSGPAALVGTGSPAALVVDADRRPCRHDAHPLPQPSATTSSPSPKPRTGSTGCAPARRRAALRRARSRSRRHGDQARALPLDAAATARDPGPATPPPTPPPPRCGRTGSPSSQVGEAPEHAATGSAASTSSSTALGQGQPPCSPPRT